MVRADTIIPAGAWYLGPDGTFDRRKWLRQVRELPADVRGRQGLSELWGLLGELEKAGTLDREGADGVWNRTMQAARRKRIPLWPL